VSVIITFVSTNRTKTQLFVNFYMLVYASMEGGNAAVTKGLNCIYLFIMNFVQSTQT